MSNYITKKISKYTVYYLTGGTPASGMAQTAEIDCFDDMGNRTEIIYFFPDDIALPANSETVNGIYLYFNHSRFSEVITMLKDEKPLSLFFYTDKKTGGIQTGIEPVGEQERTAIG